MNYRLLMRGFLVATPSFAAKQVVRIGIASNFSKISSSASNPYSNYFREGLSLALKDQNAALEAKGIAIEIVEFDYGDSQFAVLEAANKACQSDVAMVLGYAYSSHALLAAPIHQKCQLPLLTPSASADRLGRMGAYVHQATFDNSFQGEVLADYAFQTLKAKKAVILPMTNCAYCQDLSTAFQKDFEKLGGVISKIITVSEEDSDIHKAAIELGSTPFDVAVVPNHELDSARLIRALVKSGVKTPFLGGDGWGNLGEQFFGILGDNTIEGYSLSHWFISQSTSKSKKFTAAFRDAFKKDPNDTAVLAYDATGLMVHSVLQAKALTRRDIEFSLSQIQHFEGVTGTFKFQKDRAPKKSIVLLRTNGHSYDIIKTIEPRS